MSSESDESNIASFPGFDIPRQNWFKMPNNWTDITAAISSIAELKVVEYMPPEYLGSDTLPGTFFTFAKEGSESLIKAFDAEIKTLLEGGEGKKIMAKYGLTSPAYLTGKM